MARIDRFEDLIAWQKSRALVRDIHALIETDQWSRRFVLRDQLQRAAVSVMSNIAEGFERGGRGEFHQFLSIAKGSCAEVRSLLYVAADAGYLSPTQFRELNEQAPEVSRLVGGLRAAVARQRSAPPSVLSPQSSTTPPEVSL